MKKHDKNINGLFTILTKQPNPKRLFWVVFGSFFAVVGVGVGVFSLLKFIVLPDEEPLVLVQTTVTIMGTLTVGAVAVIQYRKHKIVEIQALDTQRVQTGERLSRAIEHLGNEKESIRIGALYEFKRLAVDSPGDREDITAILNRFFRDSIADTVKNDKRSKEEKKKRVNPPRPANEAIIALEIMQYIHKEFGIKINLHKLEVIGFDLRHVNFSKADLGLADLRGADFSGANLSDADLRRADLFGANLSSADLSRAILWGADLSGADLSGADLSGADLSDADLSDADLSRAALSFAILSRADLSDADLNHADLNNADLRFANLSGAENMTLEQVKSARRYEGAILPKYLIEEREKEEKAKKKETAAAGV